MTWYITRESVKAALDSKETARNNAQVDRCIASATDQIRGLLRLDFDPLTTTRYFDPPSGPELWFDKRLLARIDSMTVDDVAVDTADYNLLPPDGPPYYGIRADSLTSATLSGNSGTPSIAITGLWMGDALTELTLGATAEALDASETGVDLDGTTSAAVGVGTVIRIGEERMTVTARSQLSTGVTLSSDLTASKGYSGLVVSSGASLAVGETVMIDSEKMMIHEIAGNAVIVSRAVDGSVLASHTSGVAIYAPRTVTVTRGALGTDAASHSSGVTVYAWDPPALVGELALAYALTSLGQGQAGYARTIGSGESEREAAGRGLRQIEARAVAAYKLWRFGAV